MPSVNLGRVSIVPKGVWSNSTNYEKLDVVTYGGGSYIANKDVPAGTSLSTAEYWSNFVGSFNIGTVETVSASTGASAELITTSTGQTLNLQIPRGVAGNESIDDSAGEGDTDKVWSADKSYTVVTAIEEQLPGMLDDKLDAKVTTLKDDTIEFKADNSYAVKDLRILFPPIQSGTGDPSPTNVRTISGYSTSLKVIVGGKNKFGPNTSPIKNKYINSTGAESASNGWDISDYIPVIPSTTYTVTHGGSSAYAYHAYYASDKTLISTIITGANGVKTFTTPDNCAYMRFSYLQNKTEQLELGEESTDYEPYDYAGILPVSWEDSEVSTIYWGYISVPTGKLVLTHALMDFGDLTYTYNDQYGFFYSQTSPLFGNGGTAKAGLPLNSISECYANKAIDSSTPGDRFFTTNTPQNPIIRIKDTRFTDPADLKEAITGKKALIELATPVEYDLTEQQVKSAIGTNIIYADGYEMEADVRSAISDVYDTLDNCVKKDGTEQVKSQNIEGMVVTERTKPSGNLFANATLVASGYYVSGVNASTGVASLSANASYDTYIINVDGKSTYTFTAARTAVVATVDYGNKTYQAVGTLISNATSIDSTGGKYIVFSIATSYTNIYEVRQILPVYETPVNWEFPVKEPSHIKSVSGAIASGGSLALNCGRTALKYNWQIIFKGTLTAFNTLHLSFVNGTPATTNYINVDSTNVTVKASTSDAAAYAHGLTIANDITLIVDFKTDATSHNSNAKITLISNGEKYEKSLGWVQTSGSPTQYTVYSTGMVCPDAKLSVNYECVKSPIWIFGDSYVSLGDPKRWPYYLHSFDITDNILLNGVSGGTSLGAYASLTALLQYGTPKIVVIATGMNDGGDSSSAPSSNYSLNVGAMISTVVASGAELVLCTIPTVATVNNEKKNEFVRNSGYRYVDFAKAVGAQSDGTWTTGMLSSDGVHPTEKGALALFSQLASDLPEIFG